VKSKGPAVLALLCIFVYVAAILFAAYQIFINIQEQQRIAGNELTIMHSLISSSGESFFSEPFRDEVNKKLRECTVLEGIIITGEAGNNQGFEKEKGSAIRWNNGLQFIPRFGYIRLPAKEVTIPGFQNAAIYSICNILDFHYLTNLLKQTLLVILFALILSFFTMIVAILNSPETPKNKIPDDTQGFNDAPPLDDTPLNDAPLDDIPAFNDAPSLDDASAFNDAPSLDDAPAFNDAPVFNDAPSLDDASAFNDAPIVGDAPPLDDMSAFDDAPSLDDIPEMNDAEEIGDLAETGALDDDFEIPDFDDYPALSTEEITGADSDDFHLDDFLDENDLELPEFAAIESAELNETADNNENGDNFDNNEIFEAIEISETAAEDEAQDENPLDSGVYVLSETDDTPANFSKERPNGLYSPRSNIGWEAYTNDRLTSELHRCATSEQDLVLLLMECGDNVNCDSKLYKKIADEAVDMFNLQDLTFEYKDSGLTVIIPNGDINLGIALAEKFRNRIYKTCHDSFHNNNDFLIGLSSRSGRLIDAERLLQEAVRALEKAREEEQSPIIAFKSDPEKYRDFIRKRL
jgi:hypothetical protein